jgi:hypothetical protein
VALKASAETSWLNLRTNKKNAPAAFYSINPTKKQIIVSHFNILKQFLQIERKREQHQL